MPYFGCQHQTLGSAQGAGLHACTALGPAAASLASHPVEHAVRDLHLPQPHEALQQRGQALQEGSTGEPAVSDYDHCPKQLSGSFVRRFAQRMAYVHLHKHLHHPPDC